MAFIINNTFNIAFERFQPHERARIRLKFADPLLHAFFDSQVVEAKEQLTELNPSTVPPEKALEFLQAAKDAQRVVQFWTELSNFVKDWSSDDD